MPVQASDMQGWNRQKSDYESAMIKVLKDSRKPLTMKEIITRIIDRGLVTVRGKTPHKSLYSIITRKEKLRKERGEKPMFNKTKDGVGVSYTLNK